MELYRLRKFARYCLSGTGFGDPNEIINEAIARTMNAAAGGEGRHWPMHVPFYVYLKKTVQGLASDYRNSEEQTKTGQLEAMVPEGSTTEEFLGSLKHSHPDALAQAIALEEAQEHQTRAKACADKICAYFAEDGEVGWIIEGHKEGYSASQIMELSGMTQTQYATARRRFRRGIEKLFPEKRNP